MKAPQTIKIYQSQVRLFILIALTVFFTHTIAMAVFAIVPHFETWAESLIQSALLLVLLFPVLYFFLFGPLILHITECEEAEEATRESEYKYRNLFEHLSDAAYLVDVETGRILDTNSQGERLPGRARGEIMGMNQSKLFPIGQEQERRDGFAAYARQEPPADFETEIGRKDGACLPVRISGVPTVLHDRKLIILFIRDLTEQRENKQREHQEPSGKTL